MSDFSNHLVSLNMPLHSRLQAHIYLDVLYNSEEKICCRFHYISTLNCCFRRGVVPHSVQLFLEVKWVANAVDLKLVNQN